MGRIPFFDLQGQKWSSSLCMFCSVFGAFDFVALVEGWVPRLSYIARVINLQHFIERHLFCCFSLGRYGIFEYNKLLQLFSIPISFWNKDVSVRHINWVQKIHGLCLLWLSTLQSTCNWHISWMVWGEQMYQWFSKFALKITNKVVVQKMFYCLMSFVYFSSSKWYNNKLYRCAYLAWKFDFSLGISGPLKVCEDS